MSIKSLARRFLAWIGRPVTLPRLPVTTKPTSEHEAELMLTALARLDEIIRSGQGRYMCIALACMPGTPHIGGDVQLQLRSDIQRALGEWGSVEGWLVPWFWYDRHWSDKDLLALARQVRLRWIAETIDAVVTYMLEQVEPGRAAKPATAQE